MRLKHLERYPLAPTADQFDAYDCARHYDHVELGLGYQTGPRRGQQLADARSAASRPAA